MIKSSLLSKLENGSSEGKDDDRVLTLQHRGFIIYIGGNAMSNERLINEHPHKTCLWFHAWGAKGAHVILCDNQVMAFDDEAILFAADVALRHSRSSLRAVNYAKVGELYKPENSQPGIFRSHRSETLEVENGRE